MTIGTAVDTVTASATGSVIAALGVAVALGALEKWVLEPWLERRWFATDVEALKDEIFASTAFWVDLRLEQAFINSYAEEAPSERR